MVRAEYGKSAKWYTTHCCICGKHLSRTARKIHGTAILPDDTVVRVVYCEDPCAQQAKIQQDAENAKRDPMEAKEENANNEETGGMKG